MKVSVKFIFGFCHSIWTNRVKYWHWYLTNWLEESIAFAVAYYICMYAR